MLWEIPLKFMKSQWNWCFHFCQLCGIRGGGNAAAQALFWQAKVGETFILAFESERERNAAIMLARRFAFDCNVSIDVLIAQSKIIYAYDRASVNYTNHPCMCAWGFNYLFSYIMNSWKFTQITFCVFMKHCFSLIHFYIIHSRIYRFSVYIHLIILRDQKIWSSIIVVEQIMLGGPDDRSATGTW